MSCFWEKSPKCNNDPQSLNFSTVSQTCLQNGRTKLKSRMISEKVSSTLLDRHPQGYFQSLSNYWCFYGETLFTRKVLKLKGLQIRVKMKRKCFCIYLYPVLSKRPCLFKFYKLPCFLLLSWPGVTLKTSIFIIFIHFGRMLR